MFKAKEHSKPAATSRERESREKEERRKNKTTASSDFLEDSKTAVQKVLPDGLPELIIHLIHLVRHDARRQLLHVSTALSAPRAKMTLGDDDDRGEGYECACTDSLPFFNWEGWFPTSSCTVGSSRVAAGAPVGELAMSCVSVARWRQVGRGHCRLAFLCRSDRFIGAVVRPLLDHGFHELAVGIIIAESD